MCIRDSSIAAANGDPTPLLIAASVVPPMIPRSTFSKSRPSDMLRAALNISDGLDFENVDLGIIGGTTEAAINKGVGSPLAAAMEGIGSGVASIADVFAGNMNSTTGQLAAVRVASTLNDQVAGAIRSSLKTTTNPNSRTLFKSVQMRTFSFQFSMIPTSDREADEINRIIKLSLIHI